MVYLFRPSTREEGVVYYYCDHCEDINQIGAAEYPKWVISDTALHCNRIKMNYCKNLECFPKIGGFSSIWAEHSSTGVWMILDERTAFALPAFTVTSLF